MSGVLGPATDQPPVTGKGSISGRRRQGSAPAADPQGPCASRPSDLHQSRVRTVLISRRVQPSATGREVGLTDPSAHALGWTPVAQRGSHVHLTHSDRPGRVTVPVHAGETLKPKTLAAILDQAGLTMDDLREQL